MSVEASSPALIEKVRTAVTDDRGLFRIVSLPPGTYSVTFSLPGFNQVRRDGIELSGSFTAQIDTALGGRWRRPRRSRSPGPRHRRRAEHQTANHDQQRTADRHSDGALMGGYGAVDPGHRHHWRRPDRHPGHAADDGLRRRGRANNEGRMQVDGLNAGAGLGGSGVSTYVADISNAQEVVTTTSGGLGEVEVGGPSLSIIPKSGGNTIRGAAYLSGVSKGMVGSNYTEELRAAGLNTPGKLPQTVGLHVRHRRAHQEGPPMVLRDGAGRRTAPVHSEHFSEPECRRSDQEAVSRPIGPARCKAPKAGGSTSCV